MRVRRQARRWLRASLLRQNGLSPRDSVWPQTRQNGVVRRAWEGVDWARVEMIRARCLIRVVQWLGAVALLGSPIAWAQAPQPSSSSSTPAQGSSRPDLPPAQAAGAPVEAPPAAGPTVLRTGSTLVLVPALVKTKKGDPVFTLTADSFVVTDDGVEQKVRLEEDSGGQPLALVIVVETGGDGARYLDDYRDLGTMIESTRCFKNIPQRWCAIEVSNL